MNRSNVTGATDLSPADTATGNNSQSERAFLYVLPILGCTLVLLIVGFVAVLAYLFHVDKGSAKSTLVDRDPGELHRECRDILSTYDATRDPVAGLSPDEVAAHQGIRELLEAIARDKQPNQLRDLSQHFDAARLLSQLDKSGLTKDWEKEQREQGIKLLTSQMAIQGFYDRYEIVRVVDPDANAELRLVYALGHRSHQPADVVRLWVARKEGSWRLYDWETIGFEPRLSTTLLQNLEEGEGDFDMFEATIRRHLSQHKKAVAGELPRQDAESFIAEMSYMTADADSHDEFWRHVILQCQDFGSREGVLRFEHQIRDVDYAPGLLVAFAWAFAQTDPEQALTYANRYEDILGQCPRLSHAKCDIYSHLGDNDKLVAELKNWLRMTPWDEEPLLELAIALPSAQKNDLLPYLDHFASTRGAVLNLFHRAVDRDLATGDWLANYLVEHAANSLAADIASATMATVRGEYETAAELYLRALTSKEIDSDERFDYALKYIEVMSELGRFVEALEQLPNRRQIIDWELEEWLDYPARTNEEYRQMIELGLAETPHDKQLIESLVKLLIKCGELPQALKLLESHIELVEGEAKGAKSQDTYSLRYLRAEIHYYRQEYQQAFASFDDPASGFEKVVDMAISDVDINAVERILSEAPADLTGKPTSDAVRAWILAHRGQWQQAFDHYAQLLHANPVHLSYKHEETFASACRHTGRWIEGFELSPDKEAALRRLVNEAVEARAPKVVAQLCEHYEPDDPTDPVPFLMQLEGAWAVKDYAQYITAAKQVLELSSNDDLPSPESLQINLLNALLYERRFAEADVLADKMTAREPTAWAKAVATAAQGSALDLDRALRLPPGADLTILYQHPILGSHFLEDRFRPLHERSPVTIPIGVEELVGVLYLDSPLSLSAAELTEAKKALGRPGTISPREPVDPHITSAMVSQFGEGSVWLATGTGWHDGDWISRVRRSPYAALADADTQWLAVGVTGWNEKVREPLVPIARQLAVELAAEQTTHICAASRTVWQDHHLWAADPRLLRNWVATGLEESVHKELAVIVPHPFAHAAEKEGKPSLIPRLRKALYQQQRDSTQSLTVWATVAHPIATAPLQLKVRSVEYREGAYQLLTEVISQSILLPELTVGLPMRFGEHAIEAFQIGEGPVIR